MREYHREPRLKRYGLPIVSSLVMPDCDLELRRRYFSMLFQWFNEDLSPARFELTAPRLGISGSLSPPIAKVRQLALINNEILGILL